MATENETTNTPETAADAPTPKRRGRPPKSAASTPVETEKATEVGAEVANTVPETASEQIETEKGSEVTPEDVEAADIEVASAHDVIEISEVERELAEEIADEIDLSNIDALLLPAQFHADPWGDTPMQMRSGA